MSGTREQSDDDKRRPSLDEVREVIATMVERSERGWIGEGEEIATELLAFIDGHSPNTPTQWKLGMDEWAYIVNPHDPGHTRGPFDSYQKASDFLALMPEYATARSPIGPTANRDSYVVLTRAEYRRANP